MGKLEPCSLGPGRGGPADTALDRVARAGADLLLRFVPFYFRSAGSWGRRGSCPRDDTSGRCPVIRTGRRGCGRSHLLWLASGSHMLMAMCWAGRAASLGTFNLWPRATLCGLLPLFPFFVRRGAGFLRLSVGWHAAWKQDSSRYSSPTWLAARAGAATRLRASLFLPQWEWLRIYFESGLVRC